jgi:hypothetical protein
VSNALVYEDLFNLFCGNLLGQGIHRSVFECKLRDDLVVKVEKQDPLRNFSNIFEMQLWDDNQYCKEIAKWLAPCEFLSPDGRVLLQKKCSPVPYDYKLPLNMPTFLTDLKRENFGILNGNLVCVDYAIYLADLNHKPKKADWR